MESIIAMSTLAGRSRFERSALPSEAQAELHVARDFFDLVHRLDIEAVLERLAEAAHVIYSAQQLAEGKSWDEPGDDYLLRYPLLEQYAGQQRDPARTNDSLVSYENLKEHLKESNRDFVRTIPGTLAAAGYVIRPARRGEPPPELSKDEQVPFLAEQEHERWLIGRLSEEWSWAPGPKNTQARTNPAMVPWRQMSEEERVATYGPEGAARLGDGELSPDEKRKNIELIQGIPTYVMNAKRWAHASPSFLQFDVGDPAASGRGACVRAIEEAAAYVARAHRDIITELTGLRFGEAVFTGGAGRGRLWPQIMADVLGVPVHIPAVTESSALGAAICAGTAAGAYSGLLEPRPALRRRAATFEPDPAAVAAYDERYANWREVYRRMLDITDDGLLSPLWRAAGA